MSTHEVIVFGAGCFWGVQDVFDKLPGIINTEVGYAGGHVENPSYQDVCTGNTGHAEVVKIEFNSNQISLDTLLEAFWQCHDPTSLNRQGPDIGSQYRSCIFYTDLKQLEMIEASKKHQEHSGQHIVTEIKPLKAFYKAEEYHQHYHKR